jgi:hypothetical protein
MKIYFIGASVPREESADRKWPDDDTRVLRALGAAVGRAGHEAIICSPYPNSVDVEIMHGLAEAGGPAAIEAHFPVDDDISALFHSLMEQLGLRPVKEFYLRQCSET